MTTKNRVSLSKFGVADDAQTAEDDGGGEGEVQGDQQGRWGVGEWGAATGRHQDEAADCAASDHQNRKQDEEEKQGGKSPEPWIGAEDYPALRRIHRVRAQAERNRRDIAAAEVESAEDACQRGVRAESAQGGRLLKGHEQVAERRGMRDTKPAQQHQDGQPRDDGDGDSRHGERRQDGGGAGDRSREQEDRGGVKSRRN